MAMIIILRLKKFKNETNEDKPIYSNPIVIIT